MRICVLKIGIISSVFHILLEKCCTLSIEDGTEFEYALRGKAWKVYWLLLKNNRSMGSREVQRKRFYPIPSDISRFG